MKRFISGRFYSFGFALCLAILLCASSQAVAQQSKIPNAPKPAVGATTRALTDAKVIAKANMLVASGQYGAAQELLEARIKMATAPTAKQALQVALADVQYDWAMALTVSSDFENAIRHFLAALDIDQKTRPKDAALDLNSIGLAYDSLSQYEKALEYYRQALAIFRADKNRQGEGAVLNNMGLAYNRLSQYEKALQCFQRSSVIGHEVKDRNGEGVTLGNIGLAYGNLGQGAKSLEYYQQALAIFREIKDQASQGVMFSNIGSAYMSLSQYEKALQFFQQSLTVVRADKDRQSEGVALNNIGAVYNHLSQYEKALEYYQQARAIYQEVKDRRDEGVTLNNIGEAYSHLSQVEKVLEYDQQALTITREVKDRQSEEIVLSHMMAAWKSLQSPELAIFYGKQAINVTQSIRADIAHLDKTTQRLYATSNQDRYRTLADLLIAQGRLPEAEQVLQLLKQDEFFTFVQRDATRAGVSDNIALTPAEAESVKKYDLIANDATQIGVRMAELDALKRDLTTEENIEYSKLQAQQQTINERWTIFTRELKVALAATPRDKPIEVNEGLQSRLAKLEANGIKAAVVYTLVSSDNYHAILLTAHTRQAFQSDTTAATINTQVETLRQGLTHTNVDPVPAAQALYKTVFCNGQLETALQGAKVDVVLWFLDGTLRYVPLSTLHDGQHYLVENPRLNVVITPESIAHDWDVPKTGGQVLGLGTSKAHDVLVDGDTGAPAQTLHFDGLSAVPGELRGIIADKADGGVGVAPGQILLDDAFKAQTLQRALRRGFTTVHIASHFNLSAGDDTRSFLLLGDGDTLKLSQWDTQMDLSNVDLLTLSACETGVADLANSNSTNSKKDSAATNQGAEVDSLGELAQRRGASAVISSLWSVNDDSTSQLMQNFYRLRQEKALSKGEALRQAQLMLLHGDVQNKVYGVSSDIANRGMRLNHVGGDSATPTTPFVFNDKAPFAHPFYWAPFYLIGNWR